MSARSALVLVALTVSMLPAWGCAARRAARLEGRYELAEPPAGWQPTDAGGADRAWYHPQLAASIYADSNCGERFEDGPLGDLSAHLVAGIATGEPVREDVHQLDGREAMTRVVQGRLDGVVVQLGTTVLIKDSCTYDFLYIAPPGTFDAGWDDFTGIVAGFRTWAD